MLLLSHYHPRLRGRASESTVWLGSPHERPIPVERSRNRVGTGRVLLSLAPVVPIVAPGSCPVLVVSPLLEDGETHARPADPVTDRSVER
jgi:hypothetical protein